MAPECQKIMACHSFQQMPEEILLQNLSDYYSHTKTFVHKLCLSVNHILQPIKIIKLK